MFSSVKPSRPRVRGLDEAVEVGPITLNCTVTRVKPENVTFLWCWHKGKIIQSEANSSIFYEQERDGTFTVTSVFHMKVERAYDKKIVVCRVRHGINRNSMAEESRVLTVTHSGRWRAKRSVGNPSYSGRWRAKRSVGNPSYSGRGRLKRSL